MPCISTICDDHCYSDGDSAREAKLSSEIDQGRHQIEFIDKEVPPFLPMEMENPQNFSSGRPGFDTLRLVSRHCV